MPAPALVSNCIHVNQCKNIYYAIVIVAAATHLNFQFFQWCQCQKKPTQCGTQGLTTQERDGQCRTERSDSVLNTSSCLHRKQQMWHLQNYYQYATRSQCQHYSNIYFNYYFASAQHACKLDMPDIQAWQTFFNQEIMKALESFRNKKKTSCVRKSQQSKMQQLDSLSVRKSSNNNYYYWYYHTWCTAFSNFRNEHKPI